MAGPCRWKTNIHGIDSIVFSKNQISESSLNESQKSRYGNEKWQCHIKAEMFGYCIERELSQTVKKTKIKEKFLKTVKQKIKQILDYPNLLKIKGTVL